MCFYLKKRDKSFFFNPPQFIQAKSISDTNFVQLVICILDIFPYYALLE